MLKPDHTCNRADVDNVARPLLTHDRQHGAHDVHHAIEICSELAFDLGCGHLFKITKQAVARIVDHDVDAAELLHRLIDSRFRSCFVGNVQLLGCNVAVGTTHFVEVSSDRDDAVTGLQCRLGIPALTPLPAPVL